MQWYAYGALSRFSDAWAGQGWKWASIEGLTSERLSSLPCGVGEWESLRCALTLESLLVFWRFDAGIVWCRIK